jgi:hypothetical protein
MQLTDEQARVLARLLDDRQAVQRAIDASADDPVPAEDDLAGMAQALEPSGDLPDVNAEEAEALTTPEERKRAAFSRRMQSARYARDGRGPVRYTRVETCTEDEAILARQVAERSNVPFEKAVAAIRFSRRR